MRGRRERKQREKCYSWGVRAKAFRLKRKLRRRTRERNKRKLILCESEKADARKCLLGRCRETERKTSREVTQSKKGERKRWERKQAAETRRKRTPRRTKTRTDRKSKTSNKIMVSDNDQL